MLFTFSLVERFKMTQTYKKWIPDNSIDGVKILIGNGQFLRGRNFNNTADINLVTITSADIVQLESLLEVNGSLPIPQNPKQLATIEYIQNYVMNKSDAKDAVDLLCDEDIPLTGPAPLVVDGRMMAPDKSVALTDLTDSTQRGIYTYAEAAGNYTLTRRADFDQLNDAGGLEVTKGAYFRIISGTVYSGYEAQLTTNDPIVIGTTALTFAKYPSSLAIAAGDMLAKTGNKLFLDLASISGLESTNPGDDGGQLRVKVDQSALSPDRSTRLNPSTGALEARKDFCEPFTLSPVNVSNGYVDIPHEAARHSVDLLIEGAPPQHIDVDFTVNYTGGAGGVTRVTFINQLASAGQTALAVGEKIWIKYKAFA